MLGPYATISSVTRRQRQWSDIARLLGAAETGRQEFKRQVGSAEDVARQVAAMAAADGGEIYYGVDEDRNTGLAGAIRGLEAVSRQEERVCQIIRSKVAPVPVPEVDVYAVHDPSSPGRGVLVVDVPRSENGPHMVDGRYPIRDGTKTRYLDHHEVQQRLAPVASPEPSPTRVLLENVALLPGMPDERVGPINAGYGVLRVAARPTDVRLEHPDHPQLGSPLRASRIATERRAEAQLAVFPQSAFLLSCDEWTPAGTSGWSAGWAGRSLEWLRNDANGAAFVGYPWHTTIELTLPTTVAGHRGVPDYACAFEPMVAAELWTMLVFLAEFYKARETLRLEIVLHLAGFDGAVSYHATHASERIRVDHLKKSGFGVLETTIVDAASLGPEPEAVARRLLARWLLAFYEGSDLLDYVLGRP
jgi:hypothetical protein